MRTNMPRLAGVVILAGAIFGLILSLYGLYALWVSKSAITAGVVDIFSLANRSLDATDNMLLTVQSSLDQGSRDMALIQTILEDTANTMGESTQMVDNAAKLMGEDMPQFVENTQTALRSTQTTARLIDDMLRTISSIPFIGPSLTQQYSPEVPLGASVAQVNSSLDPLNESFGKIEDDLARASASMATIQAEMGALSKQVGVIQTSIDDASQEVSEYQVIIAETRDRVEVLQARVPLVVDTVYLAITVVLTWVFISQLGALLHAAELWSRVHPD